MFFSRRSVTDNARPQGKSYALAMNQKLKRFRQHDKRAPHGTLFCFSFSVPVLPTVPAVVIPVVISVVVGVRICVRAVISAAAVAVVVRVIVISVVVTVRVVISAVSVSRLIARRVVHRVVVTRARLIARVGRVIQTVPAVAVPDLGRCLQRRRSQDCNCRKNGDSPDRRHNKLIDSAQPRQIE